MINGSSEVCHAAQNTYTVNPSTGHSYQWQVSNGTIIAGQGSAEVIIEWGVAGVGNITLTETNNATSCEAVTELTNITIHNLPVLLNSAIQHNICRGNPDGAITLSFDRTLELSWNNGMSDSTLNGLHPGEYIVTATDPNTGCAKTFSFVIEPDERELPEVAFDTLNSELYLSNIAEGIASYQWMTYAMGQEQGQAIPVDNGGLEARYLPAYSNHHYYVIVRYPDGCTHISENFLIEKPTRVQSELERSTKIYPNPNDGHFRVEISNELVGECEVQIFESRGGVLSKYSQKATKNRAKLEFDFNLEQEASATYLVKIIFKDNQGEVVSYTQKVVKQ